MIAPAGFFTVMTLHGLITPSAGRRPLMITFVSGDLIGLTVLAHHVYYTPPAQLNSIIEITPTSPLTRPNIPA